MKAVLVAGLSMLLGIFGCTERNRISSSESIECQRMKILFNNLEEQGIQNMAFFDEDVNEPVDEATFEEFKEVILNLAGCCVRKPHPLAKEWEEYNRLECIWETLESENIQKIAFCGGIGFDITLPDDWQKWAEITEPERIKEVMKLLCKAMKKEEDRSANLDTVVSDIKRMQIITDKHKFIMPISCYSKAIYGIGWTSYELREKLEQWGFLEPKKVRSEQEYVDSLGLCVRTAEKQTLDLIAQHKWLKHRLDRCIEKLEAERGLTPMPVENLTANMYAHLQRSKIDPNETMKYAPKTEPFYVPYECPNQPDFPTNRHYDIGTIRALLGLQCTATAMYMSDSKNWIANFEERLKRLESHLED